MSVPDGVAARQGWCPRCRAPLTVPPSSVAPPPPARLPETAPTDYEGLLFDLGEAARPIASPRSPVPPAPPPVPAAMDADQTLDEDTFPSPVVTPPEELLKFRCSHCGQKMAVSGAAVGTVGSCPRCGAEVRVLPESPDITAPMVRRPTGTPTDYVFKSLPDTERLRIEEEERFRVVARARAEEEEQVKRQIQARRMVRAEPGGSCQLHPSWSPMSAPRAGLRAEGDSSAGTTTVTRHKATSAPPSSCSSCIRSSCGRSGSSST